jgi:hypothetical protein
MARGGPGSSRAGSPGRHPRAAGCAPELDDDDLLGLGEHRAAGPAAHHDRVCYGNILALDLPQR